MEVVLASFRRCFQAFKRHHLKHHSSAIQDALQASSKRTLQALQEPFRRPLQVLQAPSLGAIPGAVQTPFKVRLTHHSDAVQAPLEMPFSGVVRGTIGGAICSIVQAPYEVPLEASFRHHWSTILEALLKRHFQAAFIRRSGAIEGVASLVCLVPLTPNGAAPF